VKPLGQSLNEGRVMEIIDGWATSPTDTEKVAANRLNARKTLDAYARRPGSACLGNTESEDYYADLCDLICDLMHLADEVGPGDGLDAIGSAEMHYRAETVVVRIVNTYEDGHESCSEHRVVAPQGDLAEWWEEVVFPLTGDGHGAANPNLGTCYEATVIACDQEEHPGLLDESWEWV